MKGTIRWLAAVMVTLTLAAPALAETKFLDVTIAYRERIALPPDAAVDVELLDTSRADAPAIRLASQRFRIDRVPQTVSIGYDPSLIDQRHTYTVAARILSHEKVLFRTTTAYLALTRGAPEALYVTLTRAQERAPEEPPVVRITGIAWEVFEIAGRMLIADDKPTLTIDDEGRFGLFGGCNRFTGSVDAQDGRISFPAQFAGTAMACLEPQARLERDMLEALGNVTGYQRSGTLLAFTNTEGAVVLRLRERPE